MQKTIAILYPGEMGASVGSVLKSRGYRVVTTLGSRSARTVDRANNIGLEILPTLTDVAAVSDIIISLLAPDAALAIAEQCLQAAGQASRSVTSRPIFIDMNSIGPDLSVSIAKLFHNSPVDFVDGSINGLAKNLTQSGTVFLSGPRSSDVAELFGTASRVRVLGDQIGSASTIKMLLAGLSKGVCALFIELALIAQKDGTLGGFLTACREIYPGIAALIERMTPTYTEHAGRRKIEMEQLQTTATTAGVHADVIDGIAKMHAELAKVPFASENEKTFAGLNVTQWIEELAKTGFASQDERHNKI